MSIHATYISSALLVRDGIEQLPSYIASFYTILQFCFFDDMSEFLRVVELKRQNLKDWQQ